MKLLLLMRHAKSSWKHRGLADHDRPLNTRGWRDAPRMGRWLRDQDLAPQLVISSTAVRARSTAEAVIEQLDQSPPLELDAGLYHAPSTAYLDAARRAADDPARVMLVGHNPGAEEALEALTGRFETMPTAAVAVVELPIAGWPELGAATRGRLVHMWRPKELLVHDRP